jgi:membrane-associated phospholipid phosphatase
MSYQLASDPYRLFRRTLIVWILLLVPGLVGWALLGDPPYLNHLRDHGWFAEHLLWVRLVTVWGPYPFYGLFLGMIWRHWRGTTAQWTVARGYLVAQLIGSIAIVRTLKMLFGRPRPDAVFDGRLPDWIGPTFDSAFHSFPSGHTADLITGAVFIAFMYRGRWPTALAFAWALLVSFTRLVLAKHYLSDAVAGLAIGGATALAVLRWWVMPRLRPVTGAG